MHKLSKELTEARKEEHKNKTHVELLNSEHILEDVRLTLSDNIISANAIIKIENTISEITFSRRKLRTIIYSLINNGIKFKAAKRLPEIMVTTRKENDCIVISVKGSGMGIDESKFDAIFSKYFRSENEINGSGIGLYLVKEIVSNAGGKVLAKGQLDRATVLFNVEVKISH